MIGPLEARVDESEKWIAEGVKCEIRGLRVTWGRSVQFVGFDVHE